MFDHKDILTNNEELTDDKRVLNRKWDDGSMDEYDYFLDGKLKIWKHTLPDGRMQIKELDRNENVVYVKTTYGKVYDLR